MFNDKEICAQNTEDCKKCYTQYIAKEDDRNESSRVRMQQKCEGWESMHLGYGREWVIWWEVTQVEEKVDPGMLFLCWM